MPRRLPTSLIASTSLVLAIPTVSAQTYSGGGLKEGLRALLGVRGIPITDVRSMVLAMLMSVLSLLGLAAVLMIITAGIRMIVSQGDPTQVEKAKKTIIWALAGLVVVLCARFLVQTVISLVYSL